MTFYVFLSCCTHLLEHCNRVLLNTRVSGRVRSRLSLSLITSLWHMISDGAVASLTVRVGLLQQTVNQRPHLLVGDSHFVDRLQLITALACIAHRTTINQSIKFIFQATRNNYNIINVTALERLPEKHYAH